MSESHPKDVGLEDAVAFLDQVFELLDRKDFNPSEKICIEGVKWGFAYDFLEF